MFFIPLLILNVAGDETVLGKIEVTIALVSITVVYILGRITTDKHRSKMMLVGALLIITGGVIVAFTIQNDAVIFSLVKVSFLGIVLMKIFQVSAEPIINVSFAATNLSDIEKASAIQKRDSYSYVFDNDIFMNTGRIAGGVLFLLLNYLLSPIQALQFIFIILGVFQLVSSVLVKKLNRVKLSPQAEPEVEPDPLLKEKYERPVV
jgi:YQGE family putative transporter